MSRHHQGIGMTSLRTRERLIDKLREMGIRSEIVLDVIRNTPRHLFVDEAMASRAYENTALPIGHNQTISQPYIVAKMTEAVFQGNHMNSVLEIGTGCGYQTAVLAQLYKQVFSIERISRLFLKARKKLQELKYYNVKCRYGDGNKGWQKYAPYNAIVVSAAPVGVPQPLLDQLAEDGRLVIPVGDGGRQELLVIKRKGDDLVQEHLELVSFVPMLKGVG